MYFVEKEKQLSMALALIPLFFVALFLRLEGFFPALFEPVLWRMQPVGTVLSIVLQYYATAVLLCAVGVKKWVIFLTVQMPGVCVALWKWASHQLGAVDGGLLPFLGMYGLLMPLLSMVLLYLNLKIAFAIYHRRK